MTMPLELVLVRHGQSEQNLANRRARAGDLSLWTDEMRSRHGSDWRLTDMGVDQARAAGQWIEDNIGYPFDRYYTSYFRRAVETAGLIGPPDASWYCLYQLREREHGEMDGLTDAEREEKYPESMRDRRLNSLLWKPPNGESIVGVAERLYSQLFGTFHRQMESKRVLIVSHGEVMWAFRFLLEYMTPDRWHQLDASDTPEDHIHNCQVLHYSRIDPWNPEHVSDKMHWMRSVWPYDLDKCDPEWKYFERPSFTSEQLLEMADLLPRLIAG